MAQTQARGATVIIMNPRTGEILAMASRPTYDPNKFYRYAEAVFQPDGISRTKFLAAITPNASGILDFHPATDDGHCLGRAMFGAAATPYTACSDYWTGGKLTPAKLNQPGMDSPFQ